MKCLPNYFKALAFGAISTLAVFSAHAGSGDDALEASMHLYKASGLDTEWQNVWMPQASAHAPAVSPSGDVQMGEIIASYTRSRLDRGGWENTWMSNSNYTAPNPLLAVGIGSGATSPRDDGEGMALQLTWR